jgi:hypothetical protein
MFHRDINGIRHAVRCNKRRDGADPTVGDDRDLDKPFRVICFLSYHGQRRGLMSTRVASTTPGSSGMYASSLFLDVRIR